MRTVIDLDIHKHPAPDCFAFSSGASLWTDSDTPRTDRPAVFYLSKLGAPCPHIVRPPVGFRRVTSR